MKNVSTQFREKEWTDWHGNKQAIPSNLQRVARAFIDLQTERHSADYDNHEQWSATEVQTLLKSAQAAFDAWLTVRTDPMAGNYLLAMLLGKAPPKLL